MRECTIVEEGHRGTLLAAPPTHANNVLQADNSVNVDVLRMVRAVVC